MHGRNLAPGLAALALGLAALALSSCSDAGPQPSAAANATATPAATAAPALTASPPPTASAAPTSTASPAATASGTPATPTPTATATATPTATPAPGTCTQTTLGVDPATNTELAADCAALLAAKAALADAGTLNWSADTAITDWDGVTLGGTPQRVTGLSLLLQGITGAIPAQLGSLAGLRTLDLSRNRLTGSIPSELEGLSSLSALFLGENELTGCLPVGLLAVASHDLDRLGLEYCAIPVLDFSSDRSAIPPGTHRFPAFAADSPALVIDVPSSDHEVKWKEAVLSSPGGLAVCLSNLAGDVLICFNPFTGKTVFRNDSEAPAGLRRVFDTIAESARMTE